VGTGFAYRWWQRDSDRAEGETGGEPRGRANDEALANLAEGERTYPVTAQWAIDHLPASALIWSSGMSGALYYYTQFPIVRFDFINRQSLGLLQSGDHRTAPNVRGSLAARNRRDDEPRRSVVGRKSPN
jgi:hypothetical protein